MQTELISVLPAKKMTAASRGVALIDKAAMPFTSICGLLVQCRLVRKRAPRTLTSGESAAELAVMLQYVQETLAMYPSREAYAEAVEVINRSLSENLTASQAQMMVAAMLDGFGRKLSGDPEHYMAAMVASVFDASDPMAREMVLWPTINRTTPAILGVALRLLRNTKTFMPEAAELREAIIFADTKIREGRETIFYSLRMRKELEEMAGILQVELSETMQKERKASEPLAIAFRDGEQGMKNEIEATALVPGQSDR